MRILFTGHKGFLGQELIPSLAKNYSVFSFKGDLTDFRELTAFIEEYRITKIIHSAYKVPKGNATLKVEELTHNIKIATNLIRLEIPSLFFCSGKVYGYQKSISGVEEWQSGSRYPTDYYGQSKYLIRTLVQGEKNITIARFFNAFGYFEDENRFVKANLLRYINKLPMIINQNLIFDAFYALDSIPFIESWLTGSIKQTEVNLVYNDKISLMGICETINSVDNYKVPIKIEDMSKGKDYFASGALFSSLNFNLLGLENGILQLYSKLKKTT